MFLGKAINGAAILGNLKAGADPLRVYHRLSSKAANVSIAYPITGDQIGRELAFRSIKLGVLIGISVHLLLPNLTVGSRLGRMRSGSALKPYNWIYHDWTKVYRKVEVARCD